MKTILGLDLGVASIGWALVNEAQNDSEISSIVQLGVRVNPLTVDETSNFEKGKTITTNADRTLKRSMRRNLQRYKFRRKHLLEVLINAGWITNDSILSEQGNETTFETYRLRDKAATEQISLHQLARILLMINKKRGYKSSRKVNNLEEGQLIDGMSIAKLLYEEGLTPGQWVYATLREGKKYIPDFYRSDLQTEFDKIWECQQRFYPDILNDEFKKLLAGRTKTNTSKIFLARNGIYTAENKGTDKRLQAYKWRVDALTKQLTQEELAFVISELNGSIASCSGYLGAISDRSKELFFNKQTVGQYLMAQLSQNPHTSLTNKVFYRQDYLDEFNTIWETQAKYHEGLSPDLKNEIRDIIIFYQRKLKSQKGLISFCEFESKKIDVWVEGCKKTKTTGLRVSSKSSPLFQEFKIWQILNNITLTVKGDHWTQRLLDQEEKEILFEALNISEKLTKKQALDLLFKKNKDLDLNFESIDGNKTQASLFKTYQTIVELSGHGKYEFSKMPASEVRTLVQSVFEALGYNTAILTFHANLQGSAFEQQPLYQLWHLLYSFEGDNSNSGNENLVNKLTTLNGLDKEYAQLLANISFQDDYGSLSTKAMRNILPFLQEGHEYSQACALAGYRHSKNSLTQEEKENKVYKEYLDILPKNSLRNPVVEKILNQMVHVINSIIEIHGKPDEIRIELARELKKNAKQREEMTKSINQATTAHDAIRKLLPLPPFNLTHISKNDIIRYKLYEELKVNGYHTLYSNTYISPNKLFSKEFDVEHIIPKSRLFDDSFSNKTLEQRDINIEKGNETAYDFVAQKYGEQGLQLYQQRLDGLYKDGVLSKAKYTKLCLKRLDIPEGFIERDLNNTQYIAKKAKDMLGDLVKNVVATTGSITDRLRSDWQLIDVMQELNWDKYHLQGLTEVIENRDGYKIKRIIDWTKRNDHRHHAMDALTVAFTKEVYVQYLNNMNAKSDKGGAIYGIEKTYLERDAKSKLRFKSPIPLSEFRIEARKHLEKVLISIKAKNKVVTININKTKTKSGFNQKKQLTPRGQLHNETIYGSMQRYGSKYEKTGASFDQEQIHKVTNPRFREALLARLAAYGNDPKLAFTGKNSPSKNPIYIDHLQTDSLPEKVKLVWLETVYTIRKEISPDLKLDKVVDVGIRKILEARLLEYGNNAQKAFSNLGENPIWLNQDKGISIKRVTITGISNAESLHTKRNKEGKPILDKEGKTQAVDFVSTSNNHHVAIYQDAKGVLQEKVVSFFEATIRANQALPIVDKEYNKGDGWQFLFTMKQNEYFVFPNPKAGFNPHDVDLMNPDNYADISPNLFRVQKFTIRDYVFRHHLETSVDSNNELKDITWKRLGLAGIGNIVKVRLNHLGQIVEVGEY